jgi:hypothetical protein
MVFIILLSNYSFAENIIIQRMNQYTIPNISKIVEARFEDINRDNNPEILVRGANEYVILYSSTEDSILFSISLDDSCAHRIELADVNHDSLVDILIGYYFPVNDYTDSAVAVDLYDGSLGYAPARYFYPAVDYEVSLPRLIGSYRSNHYGLSLFDAVDINGDGWKEFILGYGYDLTIVDMMTTDTTNLLIGQSYLFGNYPESLLYDIGGPKTNPYLTVCQGNYALILSALSYYSYVGNGPDCSYSLSHLTLFGVDGFMAPISEPLPNCYQERALVYEIKFLCGGQLNPVDTELEILVDISWNFSCNPAGYDGPPLDYGRELRVYKFTPPHTIELDWSGDYIEHAYYVYHPDYPGSYFACSDSKLHQIDGTNHTILQSVDFNFEGEIYWDYPFNDNIPHLVVINDNTVTLYNVELVTDAENGEDVPVPEKLSIGNPYPNPFNTSQTITIKASPGDILTVDVYNLLGQKIESIHNARVTGLDGIKIIWEPGQIPSGIYLINASTKDQTTVVKSILLK